MKIKKNVYLILVSIFCLVEIYGQDYSLNFINNDVHKLMGNLDYKDSIYVISVAHYVTLDKSLMPNYEDLLNNVKPYLIITKKLNNKILNQDGTVYILKGDSLFFKIERGWETNKYTLKKACQILNYNYENDFCQEMKKNRLHYAFTIYNIDINKKYMFINNKLSFYSDKRNSIISLD